MQHLYEITEAHKDLLKLADESEDMAAAVADTFESIEGAFEDKAVSLVYVIQGMEKTADIVDQEMKRLAARKKAMLNRAESLRNYLKTNMEQAEIRKIESPLFNITLIPGKPIVVVDDEEQIPIDYIDIKTVRAPMKKELLAALKEEGSEIPGAHLGTSSTGLMIK